MILKPIGMLSAASVQIVGASAYESESAATSHVVPLPSNQSGDTIWLFARTAAVGTTVAASGWSRQFEYGITGARVTLLSKPSAGDESVTLTTSASSALLVFPVVLRNAVGVPEIEYVADDDPAAATMAYSGSGLALVFGALSGTLDLTSQPENYTLMMTGAAVGGSTPPEGFLAKRAFNAASEDPGAWASSTGTVHTSVTALFRGPNNNADKVFVRARQEYSSTAAATEHTIPIPAHTTGDKLIVLTRTAYISGNTVVSFPEGWTGETAAGTYGKQNYYHKTSAGETSVVATLEDSTGLSAIVYVIGNAHGDVQGSTIGTGYDPASITAAWGDGPMVAITALGWYSTNVLFTAPSGYSAPIRAYGAGGTQISPLFGAHRYISSATEDPGAWSGASVTDARNSIILVRG